MCIRDNVKQIYETQFVISEQGFPTGYLNISEVVFEFENKQGKAIRKQ